MLTRSQYKKSLFEVNIDFDQASLSWKLNKKPNGNGTYKYICIQKTKEGKSCPRKPLNGCEFCKNHKK
jgi:hypothetical protein